MKTKGFYLLSELTNIVMIYVFILSIPETIFLLIDLKTDITLALSIALLIGGTYFIRTKINNFILYLVSYVAIAAGCLLVPMQVGNFAFLLILEIVFLIINLWYFFSRRYYGLAYITMYCVVLFAIEFIIADINGNQKVMDIIFTLGIIYFLMNYLRMFFNNVHIFSREKLKNEKMPYSEMVRNDSKLAIPFMVGSVLVMILLKIDFLDTWFAKFYMKAIVYVRKGIIYFVDFMDWLFNRLFKSVDVKITPPTEYGDVVRQPSAFENIFSVVFVVLLSLFIIYLIIRFIFKFFKNVGSKEFETEKTVDEIGMVEIREHIKRTKIKKEKLSPIRKQYKQTIEKLSKKGYQIFDNHTPDERAKHVQKEVNGDIYSLTDKYKKERYSKTK